MNDDGRQQVDASSENSVPADDFSGLLHSLRTRELEQLPRGARVVLSGGAAGSWYFDWFARHYPTPIERHIGVEAFEPKPNDLPRYVEWIASSLGDLGAVASASVDLVFAGEVIEHMWPDEISGFLAGAHRILRPDGHLALDSPNRRVTQAIGWLHPEHTVEFSVDEIVELLTIAGFGNVKMRGVLLGYDAERHRYLDLGDVDMSSEERVARATSAPEDAFVWWAEAVRSKRAPDLVKLEQRVWELFARFRTTRFSQLHSAVGPPYELPFEGCVVHAARGESGPIWLGPPTPMPSGQWRATFELWSPLIGSLAPAETVGWIDVIADDEASPIARVNLLAGSLGGRQWSRHSVEFALEATTPGLQFRLFSEGNAEITARSLVDVRPTHVAWVPPPKSSRATTRARVVAALRGDPTYRAVGERLLRKLKRP